MQQIPADDHYCICCYTTIDMTAHSPLHFLTLLKLLLVKLGIGAALLCYTMNCRSVLRANSALFCCIRFRMSTRVILLKL